MMAIEASELTKEDRKALSNLFFPGDENMLLRADMTEADYARCANTLIGQRLLLAIRFNNLWYEIAKAAGIIWLAKKLPFMELRDWVKEKEGAR